MRVINSCHYSDKIELMSDRVLLRRFAQEDWKDLHEYLSRNSVVRYEPYIIVLQQQTKKTSFLNSKPLQYSYTNGFRGSFSPEFLF